MPKKTKKEKILAVQRRRLPSSIVSTASSVEHSQSQQPLYQFKNSSEKKVQQAIQEYAVELTTIKNDLYKTITLALIAFSVELYLYWQLSR